MWIKIFLISILFLYGCGNNYNSDKNIAVGSMGYYFFDEDIKINNIRDALFYTYTYVQYKSEGNSDYWQTPEESFKLGSGDCEDLSLSFMYLCNKINIDTEMIILKRNDSEEYHAIVFIPENNLFYNVQTASIYPKIYSGWHEVLRIPYTRAIWMTFFYHKNVGEFSL